LVTVDAGEALAVRLRPTREADLPFVLGLEADPETAPFIHPWPVEDHRNAMSDSTTAHWIVEELQPVGFVILRAVDTDVVELKRIAISGKGKGYGRHALTLVKRTVFDDWGARRLWLDVYDFNARARALYQAEGFVAETTRPASEACGPGAEGTAIIMALEKPSPAFS
jgi:RimJ/RimL family protein N-acetyltransferase